MKSSERFGKSLHLASALGTSPIKGAQVKDGHDALEKATASLMRAELAFATAKERALEARARVRDATKKCATECRKARGTLLGQGIDFAPRSLPKSTLPKAALRRANIILVKSGVNDVKLSALESARKALETEIVARSAAREEKRKAAEAQEEARSEWDVASSTRSSRRSSAGRASRATSSRSGSRSTSRRRSIAPRRPRRGRSCRLCRRTAVTRRRESSARPAGHSGCERAASNQRFAVS